MQHIDFILPALWVSSSTIQSKIVPLLKAWPSSVNLIVHAYSPALERSYFFEDREITDAKIDYEASVQNWCNELRSTLHKHAPEHNFSIVWERDFGKNWKETFPSTRASLIVLVMSQLGMMQTYRAIIRRTDTPILALFDKPWAKPIEVIAAVDPFHQNESEDDRDVRVARKAIAVAKGLLGRTTVVHSCFIPGYLEEYRNKIDDIHRQNFDDFMDENELGHIPHKLLHGDPVSALHKYVQQNRVDILTMGSVARGILDRFILGSTAEEILSQPPCDLLLLRS